MRVSSSKRRVLSRERTLNCADYTKVKGGTATLAAVNVDSPTATLNKFVDYRQFHRLSDAYFVRVGSECEVVAAAQNLWVANETTATDIGDACRVGDGVLYPLGKYTTRKTVPLAFPSTLCMPAWCATNCNEVRSPSPSSFQEKAAAISQSHQPIVSSGGNELATTVSSRAAIPCRTGMCEGARSIWI